MTISAKIILRTRYTPENGYAKPVVITTMQLRYPRFIHSEFMTHRAFSRNASSSRAIPVRRMIEDVLNDPAMPVEWHYNEPGMQGRSVMSEDDRSKAHEAWISAMFDAVGAAKQMDTVNPHKQIVNRMLEPFGHISVVVTATEWQNFFDLRCHPDADPTMRALADAMQSEFNKPHPISWARWHLPYLTNEEKDAVSANEGTAPKFKLISAARCARVSYLNHDGTDPDEIKDMKLANQLLKSKHMSPFEHQAYADPDAETPYLWGNFKRWAQFRKELEYSNNA